MKNDIFEDYTTLRWVKWTKRKPTHNGSVFMRFNGKNTGTGFVFQGELTKLSGLANSEFKTYEDTFYWLEEKIDVDAYNDEIINNINYNFTVTINDGYCTWEVKYDLGKNSSIEKVITAIEKEFKTNRVQQRFKK